MSDVTMPQLGETVTEGTITKWFKKVGDTVAQDELLFEVSTDKVDSEVSSPASGVLMEIRVAEGDTVDVGVVLAVISADGAAAVVAPVPAAPAPVEAPSPVVAPPIAAPAVEAVAPPVVVAPVAPSVVEAPPVVVPAPVAAPIAPAPAAQAPPAPVYAASPSLAADAPGMDKVLSPVVRKLINENNLNPALISGTGPGGRITREDVLSVLDSQGSVSAAPAVAPSFVQPTDVGSAVASVVANAAAIAAQSPTAPASAAQQAAVAAAVGQAVPAQFINTQQAPPAPSAGLPAVMAGGRDEVVKLSNIRRRTGEHMVMSLSTSPHAFIAVEIDYSGVDRVRNAQKAAFKAAEGFSLTYMPFIARAVVEAANKFPNVNASVAGDSLILHKAVHLGIAVDLDFNGLMVPVVRDADGKRMRAIGRDISDLAARARGKKLSPDDITGGTFTLSNAGPYGIDLMQSIINQPQVGILSITSVKKKPVVLELPDGSDTIAIRPMGMLGLSWDHRAFDGAYAASFLAEIKSQLEGKDWSSEL
jgi:pyruvate dehydrogenase E2 component (dihydrolipoamide acetyltransferase)